MTNFKWIIPQMDRMTADNFVVTVHYIVTAKDEEFSAQTYGTVTYTQNPDESYTPYEQLTEDQVIGWVQNSLGKDKVEAALQAEIDAKKNPVQSSGTPWAA